MNNVDNKPQVAKALATPVKNQAASTPATTPVVQSATTRPVALKTGPGSDTFSPGNNLFVGTLKPQAVRKPQTLEGGSENEQPPGSTTPGSTPAGSTPAGSSPAGSTPPLSEEGKKAVETLLDDGHFGIIASSDGDDTLTKEEAQSWLDDLKNMKDTTRGPFTGETRNDMISALTYLTTDDHFDQLAGIDGDKTSISQSELEQAKGDNDVGGGGPGGLRGSTPPGKIPLPEGQKKVKDALGTLFYVTNGADIGVDSAVRNAVIRGGPADGEVGFTKQGVKNLAEAKLDDDNIWQDVPKDKRQAVQDAAKVLMGTDEKDKDAAEAFNAALAQKGNPDHMSLDEVKAYINDPTAFPKDESALHPLVGNNFVKVSDLVNNPNLGVSSLTPEQISQIKQYAADHKDQPEAVVQLNNKGELAFADKRTFEEYKGIKLDVTALVNQQNGTAGLSTIELNKMKKVIDTFEKDPEGKILLENLKKQGGSFVNEETPGARATNAGGHITITDQVLNQDDFGDTLEVLGHEMTHSVPNQGDKNDVWSEAIPSYIGMRIRYRQTGEFKYKNNITGEEETFGGDINEATQKVYNIQQQAYFRDHPEAIEKFKNGEINPQGMIDALKALGIDLTFLNLFDPPPTPPS